MKLIHISDLHLGKRVNGISMLDDQEDILKKITRECALMRPDAVLIAGDIYDRPLPPEEAVKLFDSFLVRLAELEIKVLIISGNHDSAERVAFGGRLMNNSGIYISPRYDGKSEPVVLEDEYGEVYFYLFPFARPAEVRNALGDEDISSYEDAMRAMVAAAHIDISRRNVALVHQFIAGASRSDSEESVGGTDAISSSVFDDFDYVALGHLHGQQAVGGRVTLRYAGSPLKYSFNEIDQKKGLTLIELGEKGNIDVAELPLEPLHDMRVIKGTYEELMRDTDYSHYIHAVLTDEDEVQEVRSRLLRNYPKLMTLDYDNRRTSYDNNALVSGGAAERTPFEMFSDLYRLQNNGDMDAEESAYMSRLIESIWDEGADE